MLAMARADMRGEERERERERAREVETVDEGGKQPKRGRRRRE